MQTNLLQLKVKDQEEFMKEAVTSILQTSRSFHSTIQAYNSHWVGIYMRLMFLLPGLELPWWQGTNIKAVLFQNLIILFNNVVSFLITLGTIVKTFNSLYLY
ncbi:unnamed protein product [Malus baccata var. baccata]